MREHPAVSIQHCVQEQINAIALNKDANQVVIAGRQGRKNLFLFLFGGLYSQCATNISHIFQSNSHFSFCMLE